MCQYAYLSVRSNFLEEVWSTAFDFTNFQRETYFNVIYTIQFSNLLLNGPNTGTTCHPFNRDGDSIHTHTWIHSDFFFTFLFGRMNSLISATEIIVSQLSPHLLN